MRRDLLELLTAVVTSSCGAACVPTDYLFVPDDAAGAGGSSAGGAATSGPAAGGGGGLQAAGGGGAAPGVGGAGTGGSPCGSSTPETATFDSATFGSEGHVFSGGSVGYQYLSVSCDPAAPGEIARSFFDFATDTLPSTAVVGAARVRLCGISFGGPGSVRLLDASFALPVDGPDWRTAATDLGVEVPVEFGPHWVDVPISSVDLGAHSQYSLRLADESCAAGLAWRRYATDGDHPDESCPDPSPPLLEVSYCDPGR